MNELKKDHQLSLLKYARAAIAEALSLETSPEVLDFSDEIFYNKCGAFVTLHKDEQLRGCIGYIAGVKPIPEAIHDMALSSAFRDPRFRPLQKSEFENIDIEISVLTPIEKVHDISEIVPGRDGLIISSGMKKGLLLPQVATEQGWDLYTFLVHTCYKAGLPGDAWKKPGTLIEKFSAQVFGEKELGLK